MTEVNEKLRLMFREGKLQSTVPVYCKLSARAARHGAGAGGQGAGESMNERVSCVKVLRSIAHFAETF